MNIYLYKKKKTTPATWKQTNERKYKMLDVKLYMAKGWLIRWFYILYVIQINVATFKS